MGNRKNVSFKWLKTLFDIKNAYGDDTTLELFTSIFSAIAAMYMFAVLGWMFINLSLPTMEVARSIVIALVIFFIPSIIKIFEKD